MPERLPLREAVPIKNVYLNGSGPRMRNEYTVLSEGLCFPRKRASRRSLPLQDATRTGRLTLHYVNVAKSDISGCSYPSWSPETPAYSWYLLAALGLLFFSWIQL
jgi:hypothetical protein